MRTQEQPQLDLPAIEQPPVVERVVDTARRVQPVKSPVFWPVVFSYVLSVLAGFLIVYLINKIFGSPYNQGLLQFETSLWRVGIPLSLISTFLMGIFLPILLARKRRLLIILVTLLCQFITLVTLVIAGLYQLSSGF